MHATTMHFAFVNSKSVNVKTELGKRILSIAVRHHEEMKQELQKRREAEQKRARRLATSLDAE
jgi:hypothetical protein